MASGFLGQIGMILTGIFFVEIALMLSIKEDEGGYKFRILEWYKDSNLETYQKFVSVALVAVLITVIVTYLYNNVFYSNISGWILNFTPISNLVYDVILMLIIVLFGTYYKRGKSMDKTLGYLVVFLILLLVIFAQTGYGMLEGVL